MCVCSKRVHLFVEGESVESVSDQVVRGRDRVDISTKSEGGGRE